MKLSQLAVLAAVVVSPLFGNVARAQPRIGEPAPEIGVEHVIAGPESGIDLSSLGSQPVVIEFWTTWCGPCVTALPKWNALVAEFEGQPIRFLSISNESVETVERFLDRRDIAGWVALDTDSSMFRDYVVRGVPHTFLVDAEGTIRAETYPFHVTPEVLKDLMAGREIDLPSATSFDDWIAWRLDESGGPAAMFLAEIRPSVTEELAGMRLNETELLLFGSTPLEAVLSAYDGRGTRVEVEAQLPEQDFDYIFRTPGDHESRRLLLRRALNEVFSLSVATEPRSRQALELRLIDGRELSLPPSPDGARGYSSRPGAVMGRGLGVGALASALEYTAGMPVVDETGIEGLFDVFLEWDPADPESLDRVLAEVGLRLVRAERSIDVLVIRSTAD